MGNTPAALNYEISVTPDANSASGYADGIVSTTFTVSVMEGRSDGTTYVVPEFGPWEFRRNGVNADGSVYHDAANALATAQGTLQGPLSVTLDGPNLALMAGNTVIGTWLNDDGVWGTASVLTGDPANMLALTNAIQALAGTETFDLGMQTFLGTAASAVPATGTPLNPENTLGSFIRPLIDANPMLLDANGNDIHDQLASTLTYIDTATVAGGISTFNKVFNYQSGVACENC